MSDIYEIACHNCGEYNEEADKEIATLKAENATWERQYHEISRVAQGYKREADRYIKTNGELRDMIAFHESDCLSPCEEFKATCSDYANTVKARDRYRKALEKIAYNNLEGECAKDIATEALKGG